MSKQNVYDNQIFFENYKELRAKEANANSLVELPAFISLLPSLQNKVILDLGCGFGEHCMIYNKLGAKKVVGIDIANKMLEVANSKNKNDQIEYLNLPIEDIDKLDIKFDCIFSSLAFHYIENFDALIHKIYNLLNKNGYLIFSQEHPLISTFHDDSGPRWEKDEKGNKISSRLFDYCIEGQRNTTWYNTQIIKYHRTFASIINTLIEAGFIIDKLSEPIPSEEVITKFPEYSDNYHRPDFMIVRVRKLEDYDNREYDLIKGEINE